MTDHIDPASATSLELNRKAFIGLTAGAAAVGSATAVATAADETLGQPHTPFVSEHDPAITTQRVMLPRPDQPIPAYVAYPRNVTATTPGVVICQHVWGVDTQIRDTARRLAKEGYVAIAPELFARTKNVPSGDGATDYKLFLPAVEVLVDAQVDGDIAAGATWIRRRANAAEEQRPPKVAVIGFCMGGSIATRASVDDANFDCASIFYGKVRWTQSNDGPITDMALAWTDKVRVPFMGSYGARDTGILADDVREMAKRLTVPNDVKIYDEAGHGFFDDTRQSYVASAAIDAWTRTLTWYAKYLKS